MAAVNYKHLEYFWAVVKYGGVTRASEALFVTQPAISTQLGKLERALGQKLFRKQGRRLELTPAGRTAFRYADEIFSLGQEMAETVRGGAPDRPVRLTIGLIDALPKLVAYQLIAPALRLKPRLRVVVRENPPEQLYAELAIHGVDVLLTDAPLPQTVPVKAYNHLLGECGVSIMGTPKLAAQYRADFPRSLDNAPMLLPTDNTTLRMSLERWFDQQRIRPLPVAEIEDSAVVKVFGQEGIGLFVIPTAVEAQVAAQYQVEVAGRLPEVREQFFAISLERRVKHPGVLAITRAARAELFADHPDPGKPSSNNK